MFISTLSDVDLCGIKIASNNSMNLLIIFLSLGLNLLVFSSLRSQKTGEYESVLSSKAVLVELKEVEMGVKTNKNYRELKKIRVALLATEDMKALVDQKFFQNLVFNEISKIRLNDLVQSKEYIPGLIKKINDFVYRAEVFDLYVEVLEKGVKS